MTLDILLVVLVVPKSSIVVDISTVYRLSVVELSSTSDVATVFEFVSVVFSEVLEP